jgi:hypothetical protein
MLIPASLVCIAGGRSADNFQSTSSALSGNGPRHFRGLLWSVVVLLGVALGGGVAGAVSPADFAQLGPHPRLLADAARWGELQLQIKRDPLSAQLADAVIARANRLLGEPAVVYEKTGRRMLRPAREGLSRVLALGMAARLTHDARYRDRAVAEMRVAAVLPDWNPSHFLDTAEITLALALGYDWLFDDLSPADRSLFETAIVEKGLKASFPATGPAPGWVNANNNWTQVCHSGLVAGALAIGSCESDLSSRVLQRALSNLPGSAQFAYAPNGSYPEGPSYWSSGTTYLVILADLLGHAVGSTLGTDAYPGFLATAYYPDQMTAPTGRFFNYADGGEARGFAPALFWFARRLQDGSVGQYEVAHFREMLPQLMTGGDEQGARFLPLALLWWDPEVDRLAAGRPLVRALSWNGGGKTPVSVHRSAWDDPRALFVGIKGGPINASHAHMDLGSFVLEARGVRWAVDPGWQDYSGLEARGLDLWAYGQNADRWKVFRLGAEAHGILRFNGQPQDVAANAPIVEFADQASDRHTTVDLSSAYPGLVSEVRRTVRLEGDKRIFIEDSWRTGTAAVEVAWQWMTRAQAAVVPEGILLRQEGESLLLRVLAPAKEWSFSIEDTDPLLQPYDEKNPGLRRLVLHTRTPAQAAGRIVVAAEPQFPSAR